MTDRRTFVGAAVRSLLALPLAASGQPQRKTARAGFLTMDRREALPVVIGAIVDRLRELGYVEGRNLIIDVRHADSEERFRELAAQLVGAGSQVNLRALPTVPCNWTCTAAQRRWSSRSERPVRFALVINLATAKTLGLTIPQALLQRADDVIQ